MRSMLPKEKSPLNLVLDSSNNRYVTFGIVNQIISSEKDVVLLCYHMSPQIYQSKLKLKQSRVLYYDGFHDPLCWNDDSNRDTSTSYQKVINILNDLKVAQKEEIIVIVDDLLLFGRSLNCIDPRGMWNGMLHLLSDLSQEYNLYYFIAPLIASEGNIRALKHTSTYTLRITCPHLQPGNQYKCESILRKKSGKVIREVFNIFLKEIEFVLLKQHNTAVNKGDVCIDEVDPASNLTFNLRLTESEKEAKANTVLPYILTESTKASQLSTTNVIGGGGGHVIYTPDESDDFDDEDPDDDLDI